MKRTQSHKKLTLRLEAIRDLGRVHGGAMMSSEARTECTSGNCTDVCGGSTWCTQTCNANSNCGCTND